MTIAPEYDQDVDQEPTERAADPSPGFDVDGDGVADTITTSAERQEQDAQAGGSLVVPEQHSKELVPVDPPKSAKPDLALRIAARMEVARRPIIPEWLQSREDRRAITHWALGYAGHSIAFHSVRLPGDLTRMTVWWAPKGLVSGLRRVIAWTVDAEMNPLLQSAVRRDDPVEYQRLAKLRDDHRRSRTILMGVIAVLVLGAATAVAFSPWWIQWPVIIGSLGSLARIGSPSDEPLFSRFVDSVQAPRRLTSELIETAFAYIGISQLTQALKPGGMGLGFPEPIRMDAGGRGWRADIDLPLGVTPKMVLAKREELASALRRPLGTVWPEPDTDEHEGRLILRVLHKDFAKQKQPDWPLLKRGAHDFFDRYPFGWDVKGRLISLPMFEANALVGAQPGEGKSASVRVAVAAASLDPTCQLWIAELASKGDFAEFAPVAHVYINGLQKEELLAAAQMLTDLRAECERRLAVFGKKVPASMKPDKKLTREIANKAAWGLHPILALVDECQNLFKDPDLGKQAGDDAENIIRLARAVGVHLILATQRPDSGSVPTGVSAQAHTRFCLRVQGQLENDMILGTSMYRNGFRATSFRHEKDAGIGVLVGGDDLPIIVRAAYLDGPAVKRIAERAYAARVESGTITGHAAGEAPQKAKDRYQIARDILAVWPDSQDRMWSQELCPLLEDTFPDRWTRLDPDRLAGILAPLGVETRQMQKTVNGERLNRRGVDLRTLQDLLRDTAPSQI